MLAECEVLFVPGLLGDLAVALRWTDLFGYFDKHIDWLGSQGVSCRSLSVDTEASVAENGEAIAGELGTARRRVVLVAHSKGGLDVLEALLRHQELQPNVAASVALQCPFAGSPVADIVVQRPGLRAGAFLAMATLRGSRTTVTDLTTLVRRAYLRDNRDGVAHIIGAIPTLCIATRARNNPVPVADGLAGWPFLRRLGSASDGLITPASASLSGAPRVILDGVDHTMTIQPSIRPFDQVRLTKTMLAVALGR